jgi:hypothetical protein
MEFRGVTMCDFKDSLIPPFTAYMGLTVIMLTVVTFIGTTVAKGRVTFLFIAYCISPILSAIVAVHKFGDLEQW